jgi:hypothetical protein
MWKKDAKQDGCSGQGPAMKQKTPAVGVMPGSGGVSSQENPRRVRRENYSPTNANTRRAGR